MFNDGCGSACIDHAVRFNGRPTLRLDPQNNSSTAGATGGNQQLTLGGSAQTITAASSATLVGTTTQSGAPAVRAAGWILLNGLASAGPTADGNSYVLAYTSAVLSGSTGAWVVTFGGVSLAPLPGTPATAVTTAGIGTAVMAVNNPNPNGTGSALTSGVVVKRRIDDQFSGRFGHEVWYRPTSKSAATSFTSVFCISLYNRDGQNAWAARFMPQLAIGMNPGTWSNDNQLHWVVTGDSGSGFVWVPLGFATQSGYSQHSFDPAAGSWDAAGGWNYCKIIADFAARLYLSVQVNEAIYNFGPAGLPLYKGIGDTGAKMMHFSAELAQAQSATRRYWSLGPVTGTVE